jgi:acetyl esterase/lipase
MQSSKIVKLWTFIPLLASSFIAKGQNLNVNNVLSESQEGIHATNKIGFAEKKVIYKQIDSTNLSLSVYASVFDNPSKKSPAMVFFFGGGWTSGTIKQFEPQAIYFSKRGITCFLADYRVKDRQKTTPFEALKDAKSAIRFIREHAGELNIDTSKIIAAGGSAGGHLAAATALIADYNESTDNQYISSIPNALVLYNPVFDNGPGGYGYERIGDAYKNFSPLHNINSGAPPTIVFLGNKDHLIPVETAKHYKELMEKVKSRCELFLYEGQGHGFFNYKNLEYYKKTVAETDMFLQSLGYLSKDPIVEIN